MFTRILVAVDNDGFAPRALDAAAGLAATLGAQLGLVHAINPARAAAVMAAPTGAPLATGMNATATTELLNAQEAAGKAFLEQSAAGLPGGTVAELLLRSGPPVAAILGAAGEWRADLLVVGTHGRGGMARLALGSVAEGVVREAPCPVLVVRTEAE